EKRTVCLPLGGERASRRLRGAGRTGTREQPGRRRSERRSGGGGGNRTPVPKRAPARAYERSPQFVVVPRVARGPAPRRTSRKSLAPRPSGGRRGASPRMTVRLSPWAEGEGPRVLVVQTRQRERGCCWQLRF